MNKINNIVIIGGGSSGWMTATTLISQFPDKKITLVESANIRTVGVGESTIGGINNWLNLLGIKAEDFMAETDAVYKLSIKFTDFYEKGAGSFHYPFGIPNTNNTQAGKNDWYFKKFAHPETPVSEYACSLYPQMALVNQNKISKNQDNKFDGFVFERDSAYHFDATKFGLWLRDKYALPKGVHHVLADVVNHQLDDDGIKNLTLSNGQKIEADLFIDCTGFRSLLMGDYLNEPFDSYSDILPNNSAWATRVPYKDKEKELECFTNCTAIQNGWVWNIPLWSRIGTGYVYSDKYVSDDEALVEFKQYLESNGHETKDLQFNKIKMRVGIHRRLWVKNVCTIGLSAGFIEPLESTGLYTVHEFLMRLVRIIGKDGFVNQHEKNVFSANCIKSFRDLAEFVAMHYAYSRRTDTEYWRDISKRNFTFEPLQQMYQPHFSAMNEAIRQQSQDYHYHNNFSGIHCIMSGLNNFPTDIYSLVAHNFPQKTKEEFFAESKPVIENVNAKIAYWDSLAINEKSSYQFLKETIYK